MRKRYIIKSIVLGMYWYGRYAIKSWTHDVLDAMQFEDYQDAVNCMSEEAMYKTGALTIIEIWI